MVGGIWLTENKKRPGAYINVKTNVINNSISGRGTVIMPLALNWGSDKLMTVNAETDFYSVLGYELNDEELLPLRECLKRANQVLVYKLNGGTKATATVGNLTITAVNGGSRGNDITCVIELDTESDASDVDVYTVETYLAGVLVDSQTATEIANLRKNRFVDFGGSGAFTVTAGVTLSGGTDNEITVADYSKFLETAQVEKFDVMAVGSDDVSVKALVTKFIKRLREDEGMAVQAVLADYVAANHEGIISVKNGVVLADGTVIDKNKAVYWVAGATAGANINESNTYSVYEDSIGVDTKFLNSEIISALNEGSFVFTQTSKGASVEQDINTFTDFSATKGNIIRKNRVLRVLDALSNDIKELFNTYFLGKVNNDDDGRNIFKAQILSYLESLQSMSAITNLDKQNDVVVSAGSEADSVVVNLAVMPVDSIEKLYMTVVVS